MGLKGLKDEGRKHLSLIVYVFGELALYLGTLCTSKKRLVTNRH